LISQNFKVKKSPKFEFKKSLNFEPVPKGRPHSQQKYIPLCFQNCTMKKQLWQEKATSFGWLLTFLEAKAFLQAQPNTPLDF
jgi:hypothetical protein